MTAAVASAFCTAVDDSLLPLAGGLCFLLESATGPATEGQDVSVRGAFFGGVALPSGSALAPSFGCLPPLAGARTSAPACTPRAGSCCSAASLQSASVACCTSALAARLASTLANRPPRMMDLGRFTAGGLVLAGFVLGRELAGRSSPGCASAAIALAGCASAGCALAGCALAWASVLPAFLLSTLARGPCEAACLECAGLALRARARLFSGLRARPLWPSGDANGPDCPPALVFGLTSLDCSFKKLKRRVPVFANLSFFALLFLERLPGSPAPPPAALAEAFSSPG
mmetsp:Transcript_113013/g.364904  ORF Transcript_113013/g.364904 Transcript_113013/m.364904 type:complete len:287 (+) Transcript_113013:741-1601(+)